ncbi:hypothetical protein [Georgenia wangjunii]|uniref:hypothetical protein n=1 Tax=Georgenia wangjunii TaxID=3117730 RepID=UPI002F26C065
MPDLASTLVVIDYQNVHLSGHDVFAPSGLPKHESLVHPLHFASQVVAARNRVLSIQAVRGQDLDRPQARLDNVVVFRGLPSNLRNPNAYRRSLAQQSEWTRDRRVSVNYRTLRYHRDGYDWIPQEKGIDVLVALELVRAADRRTHDIVILASHDTDLEPALAAAIEGPAETGISLLGAVVETSAAPDATTVVEVQPRPHVETAGWRGCKVLKAPGHRVWHTALDAQAFVAARDRKDYS